MHFESLDELIEHINVNSIDLSKYSIKLEEKNDKSAKEQLSVIEGTLVHDTESEQWFLKNESNQSPSFLGEAEAKQWATENKWIIKEQQTISRSKINEHKEDETKVLSLHDNPTIVTEYTDDDYHTLYVKDFEYMKNCCSLSKIHLLERDLVMGICNENDKNLSKILIEHNGKVSQIDVFVEKVEGGQDERLVLSKDKF